MVKCGALFEVRTEFLNIIYRSFGLKRRGDILSRYSFHHLSKSFLSLLSLPEDGNMATLRNVVDISVILGSHGGDTKVNVLWDVAPCSLIEIYRHFRGSYCLHYRPDDGGSKRL